MAELHPDDQKWVDRIGVLPPDDPIRARMIRDALALYTERGTDLRELGLDPEVLALDRATRERDLERARDLVAALGGTPVRAWADLTMRPEEAQRLLALAGNPPATTTSALDQMGGAPPDIPVIPGPPQEPDPGQGPLPTRRS